MPRLQKKSVTLAGHETSLALEPEFWAVLRDLAAMRDLNLAQLVRTIDETRGANPLASACRLAALRWALDGQPGGTPRPADPNQ
jgi:predicted DNA-binding ribbon-helix-helix protein